MGKPLRLPCVTFDIRVEKPVQNTFRSKPTAEKTRPKSEGFSLPKAQAWLKDRRLHLVLGIFLIFFSFFLLIACVSHVFTGRADQSVLHAEADLTLREAGQETENWMGYIGAWFSDLLMFQGFGLGALLIPFLVFGLGYRVVFRRSILAALHGSIRSMAFVTLWVSCFLGLVVLSFGLEPHWSWLSGAVGYELTSILYEFTGWGAWLVMLLLLAAFVIFVFNATSIGEVKREVKADVASLTAQSKMESDIAKVMDEVERTPPGKRGKPNPVLDEETDDEDEVADDEPLLAGEGVTFELKVNGNAVPNPFVPVAPAGKTPPPLSSGPTFEVLSPVAEPVAPSTPPPPISASGETLMTEEELAQSLVAKAGFYDPTLDLATYRYPVLDLLEDHGRGNILVDQAELESNKDTIIKTLHQFGIGIASIAATPGPTVTLYEIVPEAGVRISKIRGLEDDIALSLAALGIRMIAPMPGKGTIGIEVPNKKREVVSCRSVLETERFRKTDMALPIALGRTISNEVFITDLAKMPHLLVAGATGQGKSVGLNVILASLLYKKHPSQLKFVMVDPKKVELSLFAAIERHFLAKLPNAEEAIITDTKKVVSTLNSLVILMEQRYELLKDAGMKQIREYNQTFVERKLNPERGHHFMPYIVVVIDELADLMMTAGKEVEGPIARLAQLARAVGIHLVLATQRPSVNVITGLIKANFPARLAFRVTSKVDSRTILDGNGADQLIGYGDMLFLHGSELTRIQCPFIDTPEVTRLCQFIGEQRGYPSAFLLPEYISDDELDDIEEFDPNNRDKMFDDAARCLVQYQQGSTSLLQRKLKLGYARAGRVMDQLEAAGIVGAFEGSKPREVMYKDLVSLEQYLNQLNDMRS